MRESVHMIITEYGVANLKWRSLRERAQALIDIAHPDDRQYLITQAKDRKLIYANQIFCRNRFTCTRPIWKKPKHSKETSPSGSGP